MDPTNKNSPYRKFCDQRSDITINDTISTNKYDEINQPRKVNEFICNGIKDYLNGKPHIFVKISIFHHNFEISYKKATQDLFTERDMQFSKKVSLIACASLDANSTFFCLSKDLHMSILETVYAQTFNLQNVQEFQAEIWEQLNLSNDECYQQYEAFKEQMQPKKDCQIQ